MLTLDHLVILARSLEDGREWCQATLGIVPSAGGSHPDMGTHNGLFAIASERFPAAYAEILAIDPAAPAPARRRWFDADDPALQEAVAGAPCLVGFAARTDDLGAARARLVALGLDPGPIVRASRRVPRGLLEWQITVPDDGRRVLGGAVPALIQWGAVHPTDSLPPCGVALTALRVTTTRSAELAAIGIDGVEIAAGRPGVTATLETPRGAVTLGTPG